MFTQAKLMHASRALLTPRSVPSCVDCLSEDQYVPTSKKSYLKLSYSNVLLCMIACSKRRCGHPCYIMYNWPLECTLPRSSYCPICRWLFNSTLWETEPYYEASVKTGTSRTAYPWGLWIPGILSCTVASHYMSLPQPQVSDLDDLHMHLMWVCKERSDLTPRKA